nr:uncharacterized protein LOC109180280 [Ipomoea batatas]
MSSNEEKKIWGELERDVERDLEEEIKDGICKLALRLHRLYHDSKTLSEVSINIRMEGGTKIEIKEIKKEAHRSSSSTRRGGAPPPLPPRGQKFDWTNTLRSGPSHSPTGYNASGALERVEGAELAGRHELAAAVDGVAADSDRVILQALAVARLPHLQRRLRHRQISGYVVVFGHSWVS